MIRLLLALIVLLAPALALAQTPGRRVALVVANASYVEAAPLANPVNDGRLVAAALTKAGFAVDLRTDLDLGLFYKALKDFRGQADGAEIALIYYAGHGAQTDGENFLIPTDAEMASSPDLALEAVGLERLMITLGGAKMRVAILDACRDNPFKSATQVTTITRGLASVDVDDVLVIFSAAPGQQAADGTGGNSPFATALAKRLPQPGQVLQLLGGVVRDDVMAATGKAQRPFISASVTGQPYYLVTEAAPASATTPATSAARPTTATALGGITGSAGRRIRTGAVRSSPIAMTGAEASTPGDMTRQFVNATGERIVNLYVSRAGAAAWDEDALGDRTIEAGDLERLNLGDGKGGCSFDIRAETASGMRISLPGVDACKTASIVIAPPVTDRWTAADPKLPMASVSVGRAIVGSAYEYSVSGTYPAAKRDGSPAPQARYIRFVPRRIVGGQPVPFRAARRVKVGIWEPGAPFAMKFLIARALVDATPDLELRLCMGASGDTIGAGDFCFYSPNLVKDGPQQLPNARIPVAPPPRLRGIARRLRRG